MPDCGVASVLSLISSSLLHAVAVVTLLLQNGMVALCSVALASMFGFGWNVCLSPAVFAVLTAAVVLLGSGAQLATVGNTIAIERDWVVVLADANKDTLASRWGCRPRGAWLQARGCGYRLFLQCSPLLITIHLPSLPPSLPPSLSLPSSLPPSLPPSSQLQHASH